jgi:hypothetical protein
MTGRAKCKGTNLAVDSKWVIVSFTMVMDEGSTMVSERKPNVVWGRYCGRRKGESKRIERRRVSTMPQKERQLKQGQ